MKSPSNNMQPRGGHKLIFEGAELVGKSSIIHHVYDFLEQKYNSHKQILNGCHWINSDVGVFGTEYGEDIVEKYVEMAEIMSKENVIFEKLHISDQVYRKMYWQESLDYEKIEDRLLSLGAKIILCTINPSRELFEKRLSDRLALYPHYQRILQEPDKYMEQQREYVDLCKKTRLPVFEVDLTELPNKFASKDILGWLGEN